VFKRAKTFHALDRAATVVGYFTVTFYKLDTALTSVSAEVKNGGAIPILRKRLYVVVLN
jgi:hypothetical protein